MSLDSSDLYTRVRYVHELASNAVTNVDVFPRVPTVSGSYRKSQAMFESETSLNSAALYETGEGSYALPERRLALIHRVIVPDKDYPKEYAVLVTDSRSIFIRQKKTRSSFVLRGEMRYGTALVTDVQPKTLEDYAETSLESLATDASNISIPHGSVTSLVMTEGEPNFRIQDLWVWLTMKRQGHEFHVYDFVTSYLDSANRESRVRFYAVPLGVYFKPRRQTETRKTILRDYALDVLQTFREVLPAEIISG